MSKLGKKLIAAVTQKDIVSTEFPRATRLTRELEETKRDMQDTFDVLDEDHPNTCRCEVCRFWS